MHTLKTDNFYDADFVASGFTGGCVNDNLDAANEDKVGIFKTATFQWFFNTSILFYQYVSCITEYSKTAYVNKKTSYRILIWSLLLSNLTLKALFLCGTWSILPGIFLCMRPAIERQRYKVTSSLIGWVHVQNDTCTSCKFLVIWSLDDFT